MHTHDSAQALRIMKRTIRELSESGAISFRDDTDAAVFFGFRPEDVSAVHFLKSSLSGVWFRLKDGRVFNRYGGIDDPNPTLYESGEG